MQIIPLKSPVGYYANSYLIISGNSFSVVDPTLSYLSLIDLMPSLARMNHKYVLLTHAHIDHFPEADSYVKQGMDLIVGKDDADKLCSEFKNAAFLFPEAPRGYFGKYTAIDYGSYVDIGEDRLLVMHTPGHTSGAVAYIADGAAFVGDTVFANGYGRCDLYSGNAKELCFSIKSILTLDGDTVVYSGHGPVSTIFDIISHIK